MSRLVTRTLTVSFILSASLTAAPAQSKPDTPAPPMPGRLVATDAGHRLHVWCTGEGSPTVILLNGGGGFSVDWAAIQPVLAAKTRVCSYDRAGYAWSDSGPAPRGLGTTVAELYQVLGRAGVRPPYVLVGSSWGGLIARVFAHAHSGEVAGMVLVDASPWGIARVTPVPVPDDVLTNLDPRADEEPVSVTHLPADAQAARAWAQSRLPADTPTVVPGFLALEYTNVVEPDRAISATIAGNLVPLGNTPLVVISGGRVSWDAATRTSFPSYNAAQRAHIAEQARMAGLSRNSTFIVARASFHAVQFYEPEVITTAVLQVVTSARTGSRRTYP
jgi:pimeloyl-ACP methyl ester carboxylesterase